MKIGFLGFGEAAFNISLGLGVNDLIEIYAYDAMQNHETVGKLVHQRVEESGVTLEASSAAVVEKVELLFVAVPSSNTLELCRSVSGKLRPGQLYVDVSSASPAVKKAVGDCVRKTGAQFVDAAMMGSLPQSKHQVPIYASGDGADQFRELMTPYGMKITCAGDEPGAASAIKLVRSIYMKGIAALMLEMLQAADAYGVAEDVISSIGKSMDGISFESHLRRLVTGTAIHAERRGKELSGSLQMLDESGLNDCMTRAAQKKHEQLADQHFAARYVLDSPHSWEEIIQAMRV